MIKRFVGIYLLCIWFVALIAVGVSWAGMGVVGMGGGVTALSGDSCTGGLLFSWHMDSDTVTTGTPAGCSVGDTVGTSVDSCTITDGYISAADAGKYYEFTVASRDIVDDRNGSIIVDFLVETWVNDMILLSIYQGGGNNILLRVYDTTNVILNYAQNWDTYYAFCVPTTLTTSTRYFLVARWTTADVDPNISFAVYDSSKNLLGTAGSNNTNITGFSSNATALRIGNVSAVDANIRIYNVKIYDTYAGATL